MSPSTLLYIVQTHSMVRTQLGISTLPSSRVGVTGYDRRGRPQSCSPQVHPMRRQRRRSDAMRHGPSVGRVVDWSQSASENRLNAQEFRRFVTTPALLTKLGRLHKGDEIRVVWAYKSSTHKKFEWTAKVKGRKSSGDVIVVYDDNDREVIPYPQNSEYVLIDVINENDVE